MSEFRVMPMWQIELEAVSCGCTVLVAKPNELQFDIDSDEDEYRFLRQRQRLEQHFASTLKTTEWSSRSGHKHFIITLPTPLSVEERIAMQACGGSDPARETAALLCHWAGSKSPILLFKPAPKLLTAGAA